MEYKFLSGTGEVETFVPSNDTRKTTPFNKFKEGFPKFLEKFNEMKGTPSAPEKKPPPITPLIEVKKPAEKVDTLTILEKHELWKDKVITKNADGTFSFNRDASRVYSVVPGKDENNGKIEVSYRVGSGLRAKKIAVWVDLSDVDSDKEAIEAAIDLKAKETK